MVGNLYEVAKTTSCKNDAKLLQWYNNVQLKVVRGMQIVIKRRHWLCEALVKVNVVLLYDMCKQQFQALDSSMISHTSRELLFVLSLFVSRKLIQNVFEMMKHLILM